jgi:uncharacterized protein
MGGLQYLQKHDVEYNLLTTLNRANLDHPLAVYHFLRDECGGRYLQFIPIIERMYTPDLPAEQSGNTTQAGGEAQQVAAGSPDLTRRSWRERPLYLHHGKQMSERSITGEQYGRFLVAVFDDWVQRDIGEVYVQMFDVALANWYGAPSGLCIHSKTCGDALVMEHNGDVYSCDHFVEPAFKLGNIAKTHLIELVASPQQRKFGQDKYNSLPQYCRACDVRFACHGGCPKDRFLDTPDGEPGLNALCAGYKTFFHHIDQPMRAMTDLLRRGRAPAEIMNLRK